MTGGDLPPKKSDTAELARANARIRDLEAALAASQRELAAARGELGGGLRHALARSQRRFEALIDVCRPGVSTAVDCLREVKLPDPGLVDVEHERREGGDEIVLRDRTTGEVLVRLRAT